MKIVLLVIDGFGIGELPDAKNFGDIGANTYKSLDEKINIPHLVELGLNNIFGVDRPKADNVIGCYGRMRELSCCKDTLTGHHEMAGIITRIAPPTFPDGFPKEVIDKLEAAWGRKIIGNIAVSGTKIINDLGDEHLASGDVIVYTSADSVLQIACHEGVVSLKELYKMCDSARKIMSDEYAVGRIIARPFVGEKGQYFRTENRKDYGLNPEAETLLDRLQANGIHTVAIGKINDIFSSRGIDEYLEAHSNYDVGKEVVRASATMDNAFIFANLVETDMLYGHRRDVYGYQMCLEQIDAVIAGLIETLIGEDVLIITSDHGCDPSFAPGTDHTREYVPLLIYGKSLAHGVDLGTINGFDTVAFTVLDMFKLLAMPKSLKDAVTPKVNKTFIDKLKSPIKRVAKQ